MVQAVIQLGDICSKPVCAVNYVENDFCNLLARITSTVHMYVCGMETVLTRIISIVYVNPSFSNEGKPWSWRTKD